MLSPKQTNPEQSLRPHVIGRIIISPNATTQAITSSPSPLWGSRSQLPIAMAPSRGHHVRLHSLSSLCLGKAQQQRNLFQGLWTPTMIRRGHKTCTMAGSAGPSGYPASRSIQVPEPLQAPPVGDGGRAGEEFWCHSLGYSCISSNFFPNGENPPDGRVNHRAGDGARG